MSFRPTWYPCSDTAPHAEHEHTDGPDSYTYRCSGREKPAEPTYTAAEVKVLTETATKVAYALGRKDAGEEIEEAIADHRSRFKSGSAVETELYVAQEMAHDMASQPAQAASDATSGVPGHPEVSEAVRSPQEPRRRLQASVLREAAEAWGSGHEGFPYMWLLERAAEIEDGLDPNWSAE